MSHFSLIFFIEYFRTDSAAEIELVRKAALQNGAFDAVVARHFSEGGEGAAHLADALVKACSKASGFHYLYDLNLSIEDKILKVAQEMYGAGAVEYHPNVVDKIKLYNALVMYLFNETFTIYNSLD